MEKREARRLAISGMTCNGCAAAVTRVLSRVPGVASVEVDLAGARAAVAGTADPQDLLRAIAAAGYGARLL
ncbi:MAG TPA: heavy metal-associated domain-containing protein [Stellaceae bacterium]|nr:heavy metal-associated domain-containing protein [Stellaceae bacterium]